MRGKFHTFSFVKVVPILRRAGGSWHPLESWDAGSLKGAGIRGSLTYLPFATTMKPISAVQIGISYYIRVQRSKPQWGKRQCLWSRGNPIAGQIVTGKVRGGGSLGNSSPPQCLGGREPSLASACHLHGLSPRLFVLLSVSPTEARTTCHIDKQANDSKGFSFPKLLTSLWIELKDYRAKRGFSDLKKTTSQRGITIGESRELGSAGKWQSWSKAALSPSINLGLCS